MNKLKMVFFSLALLSSMPVNAQESAPQQPTTDTPQTFSRMDALAFGAMAPGQDGSFVAEVYPGPNVANALKAHQTFCELATIVAAATLLKYSWQLGEKIGEIVGSVTCKKKCKKA